MIFYIFFLIVLSTFYMIISLFYNGNKKIILFILYISLSIIGFTTIYGWNIKIEKNNKNIKMLQDIDKIDVEIKNKKRVKDNDKDVIEFCLEDRNDDFDFSKEFSLPVEEFDKFFGDNKYKIITRYTLYTNKITAFSYRYLLFNNHYLSENLFTDNDDIREKINKKINIIYPSIKDYGSKVKVEDEYCSICRYDFEGKSKYSQNEIKNYKEKINKDIIQVNKNCNKILNKYVFKNNIKKFLIVLLIVLLVGICCIFY